MSTTILLLLLTAAGAALLLLLEVFIRRPVLVAGVVVAMQATAAAVTLPSANIGPFRMDVDDAVMAVVLVAALARLLRVPKVTGLQWACIGVCGLMLVSLARGLLEFGAAASFNQSRVMLPFAAALLYFSTVPPGQAVLNKIGRIWLWAACGLAILALLRWGAIAADLQGTSELLSPTASFGRVLAFSEAFVVAQAAVLAVVAVIAGRQRHRWLAYALLSVSVLLQHRTAWAALLVALAVLVTQNKSFTRRLTVALVGTLSVGAVLSVVLFGGDGDTVPDALSDTATTTGTFEWRVEGWRQLLEDTKGWGVVHHSIGEPFGASFKREVAGSVTESQPHNYYLHLYLRGGLVTLALLAVMYVVVLRRLRWLKTKDVGDLAPTLILLMLVMQLVMFVSYAPDFEQGILLGLGASIAGGLPTRRASRPARARERTWRRHP